MSRCRSDESSHQLVHETPEGPGSWIAKHGPIAPREAESSSRCSISSSVSLQPCKRASPSVDC